MEFWNNIIHSALLGTGKMPVNVEGLPEGLSQAAAALQELPGTDPEEQLLQLAALAFNYRRSGVVALPGADVSVNGAEPEERAYADPAALGVLGDILLPDSLPLLTLWLQQCVAAGRVVTPEHIPELFSRAQQHKKIRALVVEACGKRGEWLAGFNPDWQFTIQTGTAEERWQTGSPEERKAILQQWRQEDPGKAREAVQAVWPQEDAATKAAFLELLAINLGDADLPFLETLSGEKSKKVKDAAVALMKAIPSSAIIQAYWSVLQEGVQLIKEKTFLGMRSKVELQVQLPASVAPEVFQSGIEKVSSKKGMKDEDYILYQLIGHTPPQRWEAHLDAAPAEVIGYFKQHPLSKTQIPTLGLAAGRFRNREWAELLTKEDQHFYPDLVSLIPDAKRERYLLHFLGQHPEAVLARLTAGDMPPWSPEVTEDVMSYTAPNVYQFDRSFYSQHIRLLHPSVAAKLDQYRPDEVYQAAAWTRLSAYIKQLLDLKERIFQSFKL